MTLAEAHIYLSGIWADAPFGSVAPGAKEQALEVLTHLGRRYPKTCADNLGDPVDHHVRIGGSARQEHLSQEGNALVVEDRVPLGRERSAEELDLAHIQVRLSDTGAFYLQRRSQ